MSLPPLTASYARPIRLFGEHIAGARRSRTPSALGGFSRTLTDGGDAPAGLVAGSGSSRCPQRDSWVADIGGFGHFDGTDVDEQPPAFYACPRIGALGSNPCQEHFVLPRVGSTEDPIRSRRCQETRRSVLACREDRSADALTKVQFRRNICRLHNSPPSHIWICERDRC